MRAGQFRIAFVLGIAFGVVALLLALVLAAPTLGVALWLAGGSYVGFLAAVHHRLDATAPLIAVALLLCGELAAWSLDERWRIRAERRLLLRRGGAVLLLGLCGLAVSALVVALASVPPSHGLLLTLAGAIAAVGAAATGVVLGRR